MGGDAKSTDVPQNAYTGQTATNAFNAAGAVGAMPNYAQGANEQFTNPLYSPLMSPTTFKPQSLVDTGNNMTGQGQQIFNMGMDPQNKQFDFYNQKYLDAARASSAAAGLSTSPAGVGTVNQGEADFTNKWAMNEFQKANTGAQTAGALEGAGAGLAASAPNMQMQALTSLIETLMKSYAQPQQNFTNQATLMGAENQQNNTAISSAQQSNQAALQNSPWAFLGALGGSLAPKMTMALPTPGGG